MKIQITARVTGAVLFEHEAENNSLRITLEAAVSTGASLARANLAGANLAGANLDGASLVGANLAGANLAGANLDGASLVGANLDGACLDGANLDGACLDGANLAGACLDGAYLAGAYLAGACLDGASLDGASLAGAYLDGKEKLVGDRPVFQIGPIGSRGAYLVVYLTDGGVLVRAGCFFGSLNDFSAKVIKSHGDNIHAKEYGAALALIDAHAELWTPKIESAKEAA